jgi:GTP-binding protein
MAGKPQSVVLVGRPNVGKSTLFNRMTGARHAIVAPVAGTTRDLASRPLSWRGRSFTLVDTGGMFGASEDPLHELVFARGRRALADATLVVLVADGREGLVAGDETIAQEIRRLDKPALLAVNKTDDKRAKAGVFDFYRLGFEPVFEISAEHGQGVADLMDEMAQALVRLRGAPSGATAEPDIDHNEKAGPAETAIAVVGRPNAGKSSLLNRLLNEERALVSELPGTTRDPVESVVTWHRRRFRIVDTAGMRRVGRVARGGKVEMVSVLAARRAIADADVVALVIDASAGATDQDAAIGGEIDRAGKGVVIVANKWDKVKSSESTFVKTFDAELRDQLKFLDYAPVLHVSALTGERASKVLETIDKVAASRRTRVPTPQLNRWVQAVTSANPPVSPGRKHVRILYAAQVGVAPPSFVFFTNVATTFHFSYERFLVNQLREAFGFVGTPVRVQVRRRPK